MRPGAQRRQRGFLIIAAVFLLVVLTGLVAYLMSVSTTSQAASAADLNSARAYRAARAGIEWGAYQILQNSGGSFATTTCTGGAPAQINLTLGSFTATVRCTSASLAEGATPVKSYKLVSNGCNEPTGGNCPNAATVSATYVEREVSLTIAN